MDYASGSNSVVPKPPPPAAAAPGKLGGSIPSLTEVLTLGVNLCWNPVICVLTHPPNDFYIY